MDRQTGQLPQHNDARHPRVENHRPCDGKMTACMRLHEIAWDCIRLHPCQSYCVHYNLVTCNGNLWVHPTCSDGILSLPSLLEKILTAKSIGEPSPQLSAALRPPYPPFIGCYQDVWEGIWKELPRTWVELLSLLLQRVISERQSWWRLCSLNEASKVAQLCARHLASYVWKYLVLKTFPCNNCINVFYREMWFYET